MTSSFSILAIDIHAKFYQRFEKISIMWQTHKSEFRLVKKPLEYITWSVNTFLAGIFSNGCCMFLILKEFISPETLYPFEFIIIQLALSVFAGFWAIVYVSSILYGGHFCTVWNTKRKLLLYIRRAYKGKSVFLFKLICKKINYFTI